MGCLFIYFFSFLGRTTGKIQQLACSSLLEVAYAASGDFDGCCRATREEIDTLLIALQSSSHIVREAGLAVIFF